MHIQAATPGSEAEPIGAAQSVAARCPVGAFYEFSRRLDLKVAIYSRGPAVRAANEINGAKVFFGLAKSFRPAARRHGRIADANARCKERDRYSCLFQPHENLPRCSYRTLLRNNSSLFECTFTFPSFYSSKFYRVYFTRIFVSFYRENCGRAFNRYDIVGKNMAGNRKIAIRRSVTQYCGEELRY